RRGVSAPISLASGRSPPFVAQALSLPSRQSGDWSMAELCEFFGVTRKTGYKWKRRFEEEGKPGLQERSRAPHQHPNQVSRKLEDMVIAMREKHGTWGAPKIRALLLREQPGESIPAESTIGEILRRQGLTVARRRRRRGRGGEDPLTTAAGPNQVWCADFK